MKISVVIPAYNGGDLLRQAIDSVLLQSYVPYEVIVVDDGSTDSTQDICTAYSDIIKYYYQNNDSTMGTGARAKAISLATGDLVALLDQDDIWIPSKLEKQVEVIKNNPKLGIVFSEYFIIDTHGQPVKRQCNNVASDSNVKIYNAPDAYHLTLKKCPFCPSSALIRKEVFNVCAIPNGFVCGDWALWLNITRFYDIAILQEMLTGYRVHSEQFTNNILPWKKMMRNTLHQQKDNMHKGCTECKLSLAEANTMIGKITGAAARKELDLLHHNFSIGKTSDGIKRLYNSFIINYCEVLMVRRMIAILKNAILSILRSRQ